MNTATAHIRPASLRFYAECRSEINGFRFVGRVGDSVHVSLDASAIEAFLHTCHANNVLCLTIL